MMNENEFEWESEKGKQKDHHPLKLVETMCIEQTSW